jgi:hypothetical protein
MEVCMNTVIIDLTNNEANRAGSLFEKIKSKDKNNEINYVNLDGLDGSKLSEEKLAVLRKINETSRVYIIDHGSPNSSKIQHGYYQDLCDLIAKNIETPNVKNPMSKLKISIIPCYAGKGDQEGLASFAGRCHRYLGQFHKIYCEVVARNELVWTKGKKMTASDANYAAMIIAKEISKLDTNDYPIDMRTHQKAGSKISLVWDHQEEWLVDAYINTYFFKTNEILTTLDQMEKQGSLDHKQLKDLEKSRSALKISLKDIQNKTDKSVKKMDIELHNIKISISNLDKSEQLNHLIDFNLALSKNSINSNSIHPKNSNIKINGSPIKEEENITQKTANINEPALNLLEKLPDHENNTHTFVKDSAKDLLKVLTEIGSYKLKREYDSEHEQNISKFMQNIFSRLSDPNIAKNEKIKFIEEMRKVMDSEISKKLIFSAEFSGALEGVEVALKGGGVYALKNLFQLVSLRSKTKAKQVNELSNSLNKFIDACINYASNDRWFQPKAEISAEASRFGNNLKLVLDKETEKTKQAIESLLTGSNVSKETLLKYQHVIENNQKKVHEIRNKYDKLLFSLNNSPDPSIKEAYVPEAFPVVDHAFQRLRHYSLILQKLIEEKKEEVY